MKIDYKSMLLGFSFGVFSLFFILFFLGDVKTEFSVKTGEHVNEMDKNIDVRIDKTLKNGKDFINVMVKGSGDVTKDELDKELESLFDKHGINKNDSNINIEIEINR